MSRTRRAAWLLALLPTLFATPARAADEKDTPKNPAFYLKNNDRVVFYGDSITEQRLYTTYVETYVKTRFPQWNVTFVHSGWGGDRVTGGGGGPIDVRLKRDVFEYKPTVMTIMLGMNDASYQAFSKPIFETYAKGYEHIVASVKEHVPGIRITLIEPSPFDDVTREPRFAGGYNAVLVRYGEFVKELAKKNGLDSADLNGPVVEATKKAFASDPVAAQELNKDRVHPGPGGQLLMAAALLKDWHAPALVSKTTVKLDGDGISVKGEGTLISEAKAADRLPSWVQRDDALPFPIDLKNSSVDLAVKSSHVLEDLDEQTLVIDGLKEGDYVLKIDGSPVGTFSSATLAKGVNLATQPTPMTQQAAEVHQLTLLHGNLHFFRWRQLQVPLDDQRKKQDNGEAEQDEPKRIVDSALQALDHQERELVHFQHELAQPHPHRFELARKAN